MLLACLVYKARSATLQDVHYPEKNCYLVFTSFFTNCRMCELVTPQSFSSLRHVVAGAPALYGIAPHNDASAIVMKIVP